MFKMTHNFSSETKNVNIYKSLIDKNLIINFNVFVSRIKRQLIFDKHTHTNNFYFFPYNIQKGVILIIFK